MFILLLDDIKDFKKNMIDFVIFVGTWMLIQNVLDTSPGSKDMSEIWAEFKTTILEIKKTIKYIEMISIITH